jgi:hypothetical protein
VYYADLYIGEDGSKSEIKLTSSSKEEVQGDITVVNTENVNAFYKTSCTITNAIVDGTIYGNINNLIVKDSSVKSI